MYDVLADIFQVDTFTMSVVAALTVMASVIMNAGTDSKMLTFVFMPAMATGALAMVFALSANGVSFTAYQDANIIMSAAIGLTIGFLMMVIAVRVISWLNELQNPVVKPNQPPRVER